MCIHFIELCQFKYCNDFVTDIFYAHGSISYIYCIYKVITRGLTGVLPRFIPDYTEVIPEGVQFVKANRTPYIKKEMKYFLLNLISNI